MPVSRRTNEEGFILITAIWLLILCGAIAALLLARSLASATAVTSEAEELRSKLTLDAATETVAADLLINGNRSPFALVPAERTIGVGEQQVRVRIGAESGKLDLNTADPRLIERVLSGLGWDSGSRALFLQQLQQRRARNEPLRSIDEVELVAARSGPSGEARCLEDYFTVSSGRSEPEPAFMAANLAAWLGRPPLATGPSAIAPGTPLSIDVSGDGVPSHRAVIRVGAMLDQPLVVSSWERARACE